MDRKRGVMNCPQAGEIDVDHPKKKVRAKEVNKTLVNKRVMVHVGIISLKVKKQKKKYKAVQS